MAGLARQGRSATLESRRQKAPVPEWRQNSTEVPVQTGSRFEAGVPRELYVVPVPGSYTGAEGRRFEWALAPAGDRIIAVTNPESNAPIMVVDTWRARLTR